MALLINGVRLLHEASETLYDSLYNITTRGYLQKMRTGIELPDANEYAATPYRVIRRLFAQLPSECLRGSFIDYGCGRGRVAIMAARFRFRCIIGVEMSGTLYRQAQENLRTSRAFRRCQVHFIQANAAEFPVPDDVSTVFFYKPFGRETTAHVLERLQRSLDSNPRELWVLGYNASLLIDMANEQLSAELVCRRNTIYPTIEWAVLRVAKPKLGVQAAHSLQDCFRP